jgi:hypothetical protein
MKNEKNDSHKIVAVLLGIAFFASLFFVHFPSAKVSTPTDKKLSINRKTYLLPETGERSYARLGYALLFDSLKKVTHVESWSHKNYPDEKEEVKLLPQELLVIANNPLRIWTPAEAKDLLAFVQRGGNALIITPTWQSFQNTGALLNQFESLTRPKNFSQKQKNVTDKWLPWKSPLSLALPTPEGLEWGLRFSDALKLRIDPEFITQLTLPQRAIPLLKTEGGQTLFFKLENQNPTHKGTLLWLLTVLPGFNAERKELVFEKSRTSALVAQNLQKWGIDVPPSPPSSLDFLIPEQGETQAQTGLKFVTALLNRFAQQGIYFSRTLTTESSIAGTLAIIPSGALQAIFLALCFLLLGIALLLSQGDHKPRKHLNGDGIQ